MRTVHTLLLSILFLLSGFTSAQAQPLTPPPQQISTNDAMIAALNCVQKDPCLGSFDIENCDVIAHLVDLSIHGIPQSVWVVSLFDSDLYRQYAVTIDACTGEIMHSKSGNHWDLMLDTWEAWGYGHYFTWTIETKALYHVLYELVPCRILPEADAISQETAFAIACSTIESIYHIPIDTLISAYAADFYYVPGFYINQPENSWLIMFRPRNGSNIQVTLSGQNGTVSSCIMVQP